MADRGLGTRESRGLMREDKHGETLGRALFVSMFQQLPVEGENTFLFFLKKKVK